MQLAPLLIHSARSRLDPRESLSEAWLRRDARLQAQIAANHATDARTTPWGTVVTLYDALLAVQPSPVITLNRAIAIGFRDGYRAGRDELETLETISSLAAYHLLPAAPADFLRRLDRRDDPAALAPHCDHAGTPVDVLQRERGDLAGAHPQAHHQQHRRIVRRPESRRRSQARSSRSTSRGVNPLGSSERRRPETGNADADRSVSAIPAT
jgi:hypothetical protein